MLSSRSSQLIIKNRGKLLTTSRDVYLLFFQLAYDDVDALMVTTVEFLYLFTDDLTIIYPESRPCHAVLQELDHIIGIGLRSLPCPLAQQLLVLIKEFDL